MATVFWEGISLDLEFAHLAAISEARHAVGVPVHNKAVQ